MSKKGAPISSVPFISSDSLRGGGVPDEVTFRKEVAAQLAALPDFDHSKRQLIALDVDGTLLDGYGQATDRMYASMAKLSELEVDVVVSTGRSVYATLPVISLFGLRSGWMVCSNGAVVCTFETDADGNVNYQVCYVKTFDPAPVIDTILRVIPDALIAVEDGDDGFRVSAEFPQGELAETRSVQPIDQLRATPVTRVVVRHLEMSVPQFSAAVEKAGLHAVEYAVGWTAWMDVAPLGVTKATGLDYVCQQLGSSAQQALALGDGSNDLEMLEWARHGVAMGHSPASLLEVAQTSTQGVESDGAPAVLDAFILWREGMDK
ncbi:MAG: HAD family hydrolase [Actinomycetaceae bacterium]|nr:HAD family hydrolase [Actinomycetaceae bacterium]